MDGFERSGFRLRAVLRWLEDADTGAKLKETAALDGFAAFSDLFDGRRPGESPVDAALPWRVQLAGMGSAAEGSHSWPTAPTTDEIAYAQTVRTAPAPAEPGSPADEEHALTQTIRRGAHSDTVTCRLSVDLGKLAGMLPAGADAQTKTLRKAIGGGAELLAVLRGAFLAMVGVPLGGAMLYFGCCGARNW